MNDNNKTKQQLIQELTTMRQRVSQLEESEASRQSDEALRESENWYQMLVEQSKDAIFLYDFNGKIIDVNQEACDSTGYTREEFLYLFIQDIDKEFLPGKHKEKWKQMAPGEPISLEGVHKRKDGTTFPVEVRLVVFDSRKCRLMLGLCRDITERKRTEQKLRQTLDSLRKAFGTIVQVMVSAVEVRDPYTAGHQIRTANIARAIATEMGLSHDIIDGIRFAGSIHDIGKLSIPSSILAKPTKLTEVEFSMIKEHPQVGYNMLKDIESPWPLAQIVYQHHERMNGSGYPRNLKGDKIIMQARIIAVADVVEAIASHRPYRPALGIGAALEEIEKNKGIFYDPAAADACLRLFREKGHQLKENEKINLI